MNLSIYYESHIWHKCQSNILYEEYHTISEFDRIVLFISICRILFYSYWQGQGFNTGIILMNLSVLRKSCLTYCMKNIMLYPEFVHLHWQDSVFLLLTGSRLQHRRYSDEPGNITEAKLDADVEEYSWERTYDYVCYLFSWSGTVMILSFWKDMPGQTVQIQIRLLLEEQSDQGLHCLPFRLHRLDSLLYGRAT